MLTKGMGKPTYGLLLSLITSCIKGSLLDARGSSAATLSRYYFILCESHGQRALNGSVLLRDGIPNLATAFLR